MNIIEDFDEYMKYFKNLKLDDKKELVIKQLKTLAGFTNSLCEEIGVENDLIINKELLDVEKDSYSEEDFTEAIIVLINSIQNSICDFHTRFCDLIEEHDN